MVSRFGRDFTLVVIGQIISLFGSAILRFALPLYLLRQTQSPALFGLVTACSFLPMIPMSLLGGVLADRANKRTIMVTLDFLTAGIVLTLALSIGSVPLVPLLLVDLMLLYGISGAYQPTVQASIPALVGEGDILAAGAIVTQVASLAGLLGPILGGVLFGMFGILPILLLSILCFTASAVMELFIRIPFTKRTGQQGVLEILRGDFRASTRYLRREKPLLVRIILFAALFNLVLSAMVVVGVPVIIVDVLHRSDAQLGIAQGALALGGLCGGMLTAVFSNHLKVAKAHGLLGLCGVCVGAMAVPFILHLESLVSYLVITIACFVIMALATMFSIQLMVTVQIETPEDLVGKVIALMMSISMCAQPLGQAVYGLLFDAFPQHMGSILLGVALVSVVIAAVSRKTFEELGG